jgi:hypothetical protein
VHDVGLVFIAHLEAPRDLLAFGPGGGEQIEVQQMAPDRDAQLLCRSRLQSVHCGQTLAAAMIATSARCRCNAGLSACSLWYRWGGRRFRRLALVIADDDPHRLDTLEKRAQNLPADEASGAGQDNHPDTRCVRPFRIASIQPFAAVSVA